MFKQKIKSVLVDILAKLGLMSVQEVVHTKVVYQRTDKTRFKPFYIHKQTRLKETGKFRGFSAYIEPSEDHRKVLIKITYCSRKDEFCRKKGREALAQMESKEINSRTLPAALDEAWLKCYGLSAVVNVGHSSNMYNMFNYVLRYVI